MNGVTWSLFYEKHNLPVHLQHAAPPGRGEDDLGLFCGEHRGEGRRGSVDQPVASLAETRGAREQICSLTRPAVSLEV